MLGAYDIGTRRGHCHVTLGLRFSDFVRKTVPFNIFVHVRQARGTEDHTPLQSQQDR